MSRLSKHKSSKIVPFVEFLKTNYLHIEVMKLVQGGSLQKLILDQKESLWAWEVLDVAIQAIDGITEMKKTTKVLNGSLDASNLLIERNPNKSIRVYLTGFNHSFVVENKEFLAPPIIKSKFWTKDSCFMAPELRCQEPFGPPSEVWSLGMLILFMLSKKEFPLKHPFEEESFQEELSVFLHSHSQSIPEKLATIVRMCLRILPESRVSLKDLRSMLIKTRLADFKGQGKPLKEEARAFLKSFDYLKPIKEFLSHLKKREVVVVQAQELIKALKWSLVNLVFSFISSSQKLIKDLESFYGQMGSWQKSKGANSVLAQLIFYSREYNLQFVPLMAFSEGDLSFCQSSRYFPGETNWIILLEAFESFEELKPLVREFKLAVVGAMSIQKTIVPGFKLTKTSESVNEPQVPELFELASVGAHHFLEEMRTSFKKNV